MQNAGRGEPDWGDFQRSYRRRQRRYARCLLIVTAAFTGTVGYCAGLLIQVAQTPTPAMQSAYVVPPQERLASELRVVPLDPDILVDEHSRHIIGYWRGRE